METNDTRNKRLLELVKERVRRSGRSHRELERELDLGHGTLGNILRGRTELRLRHVTMLGKVLGFDPAELLAEVYGQSPPEPSLPSEAPMTRKELREIVAEAVRAVLRDPATLEALQNAEEDLP
jgi:transcriptional regulator with XRE-family HTH domain